MTDKPVPWSEQSEGHDPTDPRDIYAQREQHLELEALDYARTVLLSGCECVLCFDEAQVPIRYVIDPANGRLVAPVPVASILASENILHVPEHTDDALHLLLSPEQIERGAITDRWQVYWGEPEHVRWAAYWIDSAKHGPWVFDGDALMQPNPLADNEPRLCAQLNADPPKLRALCKQHADIDIESPIAVGVDPTGIHIRARYSILHLPITPEDLGLTK